MARISALIFAALVGIAAATNAAGLKFLAENKEKEGVVTLPSGLQYKVLRSGEGKVHPLVNAPCECHCKRLHSLTYTGRRNVRSARSD